MLMGRTFSRPERMRMFFRQYLNELEQLGVDSIGIVLLISFFIGAVITIQIKLNIESPVSYTHLDVYKRQLVREDRVGLTSGLPVVPPGALLGI